MKCLHRKGEDLLTFCHSCQQYLDSTEFPQRQTKTGSWTPASPCNACRKKYCVGHQQDMRKGVLQHYSDSETPFCACCGDKTYEFLTLDHINGGGNRHRDRSKGGNDYWRWFIRNEFPEGYRVLCMNCNWAMGRDGTCPHQKAAAA